MDEKNLSLARKLSIFFVALIIIGVSFFVGTWYGYENRPSIEKVLNVAHKELPPNFQDVDFDLFWNVWNTVEQKFVDKEKINRQEMVFGAISGLVASLNDPYTEFLPPAETKLFSEEIKGAFGGIGAEIGIRKKILTIIAPLKGSPAEREGIKAGDKIFKIDDKETVDLSIDEAVRLIRGEPGTEVRLTVFRDTFEKAKEIKVKREIINIPIVTTEKKADGVFIIHLNRFTENSAYDFRNAVKEFFESKSQKLIVDLRNNPGGYLVSAVDIASWFLAPGEVVARERYADGTEEVHRSSGYRLLEKVPTLLLVNEGSASASEILAGALRDNKGIKLIGAKTYGKGSVQEVEQLPKNSSLKITIAKWLTPKGDEINGKGLEPDIKVELPPAEEQDPKVDSVLNKALEIFKKL